MLSPATTSRYSAYFYISIRNRSFSGTTVPCSSICKLQLMYTISAVVSPRFSLQSDHSVDELRSPGTSSWSSLNHWPSPSQQLMFSAAAQFCVITASEAKWTSQSSLNSSHPTLNNDQLISTNRVVTLQNASEFLCENQEWLRVSYNARSEESLHMAWHKHLFLGIRGTTLKDHWKQQEEPLLLYFSILGPGDTADNFGWSVRSPPCVTVTQMHCFSLAHYVGDCTIAIMIASVL